MSLLATKIAIEYSELQSHIKSEVFEFVKKEVPPNCLLQAEHGVLVAHKVIMAAASAHLKEIFSAHVNESLIKIFVPGVKLLDLAALINLIYCGRIEISAQQLPGIMTAAHKLKVPLPNFTTMPAIKPNLCTISMTTNPAPSQSHAVIGPISLDIQKPEQIPEQCEDVRKSESLPVSNRTKRSRKRKCSKFKVSEVKSETDSLFVASKKIRNRRLTSREQKAALPNHEQFRCPHCRKIYAKASVRHIVECPDNPKRLIAHCPICKAEVKPSGMSAHKKWHHR